MTRNQDANQVDELKQLLLSKFSDKAIYFRDWPESSPYEVEVRIDDMVFVSDKWQKITAYYKINLLNIQEPGAVVGQLSYLLDQAKAQLKA